MAIKGARRLKRGEIWTLAGGAIYSEKPGPVVIVQSDRFDATGSITVCGFTTTDIDAPMFRVMVDPAPSNGLEFRSFVMVDKINSVPREKLGYRIGLLDEGDVAQLNRSLAIFLGLAR